MIIRPFTPSDQPAAIRLQAEFMLEFFPEFKDDPRQYEWNADIYDIDGHYLRRGGMFWVAEDGGAIVGVGGFRLADPVTAEIKRIRIRADRRGQGLGKAIVMQIEGYCRDHGIARVLVDTDERLATAKAMYPKMGYAIYRTKAEVEDGETYVNHYFAKDL